MPAASHQPSRLSRFDRAVTQLGCDLKTDEDRLEAKIDFLRKKNVLVKQLGMAEVRLQAAQQARTKSDGGVKGTDKAAEAQVRASEIVVNTIRKALDNISWNSAEFDNAFPSAPAGQTVGVDA